MKENEALVTTANRRAFLKGVGMTGICLAGATMIGTAPEASAQSAALAVSDTDILNFALNLEYLEAEFYLMATYGTTLVKSGVITSADETGPTIGGHLVSGGFSTYATLATALRNDELNHVRYLRSVLGSRAVKKPAINLNAKGIGFGSVASWLALARQFEDVGRSAYQGAAPLISSKTYLAAAGAILATEGQHVGALRLACVTKGAVSPAVDALDIPPTAKTLMNVDKNGLSIPRTTAQVLNIVYAGGRCAGGFYPNGMNGTIVCRS